MTRWVLLFGCKMKTERRHELQQNSLAAWLEQTIESIKPHATAITAVVVAAVAVVFVYYFFTTQRRTGQLDAWNQYLAAVDQPGFDQLAEIGEQYSNAPVGYCAMLLAADRQLQSGVNALFGDRTAAGQDLRMALDNYTRVAEKAKDPILVQRGLIGKGYTEESLAYDSAEYLRTAKETYEQYVEEFPEGIFTEQAQIRLNALGKPATASFYDWFAEQGARNTESQESILGGDLDLDTLPDGPDSSSPVFDPQFDTSVIEAEEGVTPEPDAATEEAMQEESAEETPSEEPASETPPAEETPASEEPSSEEPASEGPSLEAPASNEETTPQS